MSQYLIRDKVRKYCINLSDQLSNFIKYRQEEVESLKIKIDTNKKNLNYYLVITKSIDLSIYEEYYPVYAEELPEVDIKDDRCKFVLRQYQQKNEETIKKLIALIELDKLARQDLIRKIKSARAKINEFYYAYRGKSDMAIQEYGVYKSMEKIVCSSILNNYNDESIDILKSDYTKLIDGIKTECKICVNAIENSHARMVNNDRRKDMICLIVMIASICTFIFCIFNFNWILLLGSLIAFFWSKGQMSCKYSASEFFRDYEEAHMKLYIDLENSIDKN